MNSLLMFLSFDTGDSGNGTNISVTAFDADAGKNADLVYAVVSGNVNNSFVFDGVSMIAQIVDVYLKSSLWWTLRSHRTLRNIRENVQLHQRLPTG